MRPLGVAIMATVATFGASCLHLMKDMPTVGLSWLFDIGRECLDYATCASAEWNGVEGTGVRGKCGGE